VEFERGGDLELQRRKGTPGDPGERGGGAGQRKDEAEEDEFQETGHL